MGAFKAQSPLPDLLLLLVRVVASIKLETSKVTYSCRSAVEGC